jgi:pantoate--beta-alanine ligase
MEVIESKEKLKARLDAIRAKGEKIGFVPTMGALHDGHLSLVQASRMENDKTVVSIFVNPTQFNDPNDLKNYPRTIEQDILLLEGVGCDLVFIPSIEEIYPEPDTRVFDFDPVDKVMEGAFRPGHFNGVAQVVSRLFGLVPANRAYFGEKDYQQLAIIRRLTRLLQIPMEIIGCPIVREADGLAMSSRNMLLEPERRKSATLISRTLLESTGKTKQHTIEEVKTWVVEQINTDPLLEVEYFEIVDKDLLQPVTGWSTPDERVGCVAVRAGKVRLIDNVKYFL